VFWASLFLLALASPVSADSSLPFWKAKEKIYHRIQEERAIVVAVHTDKIKDGETLVFGGGGQMSTPLEFAYQQAMQFENLKSVTDYIKEIRTENDRLFVRASAFGYDASMWLKLVPTPHRNIHYEVVEGTLKGLQGDIHLEKIETIKTEIGISGHYDYVRFPIPRLFAEFGMEVVLQRMAVRLRSMLEEKYRNSLSGKAFHQ
jgi:hypothetical protein